jgi:AcrR family transcriptional regulator
VDTVHYHSRVGNEKPVLGSRRRGPGGVPVRAGLLAAGIELARLGGPDAVVLREATRIVGVAPNAAYRHFADRDELLAAVCGEAMRRLAARMAARVAAVRGDRADPHAARERLGAVGAAYLAFAREEPGLFATAFAVPRQHDYDSLPGGTELIPLEQLRARLDELVEAGVIDRSLRPGLEYAIWSAVHGLAVLTGQGPLRALPEDTRDHLAELLAGFVDRALR